MLGRPVVAPDLELPVRTLLEHRCTDVIEPSSCPTSQAESQS